MADPKIGLIRRPVEMRAIRDFPERYSITCDGRVLSHGRKKTHKKPHWLSLSFIGHGYLRVILEGKSYLIHRLVMQAWGLPAPSLAHQINHIDGNKQNNHISNLEWATPTENNVHAISVLGQRRGSGQYLAKLTETDIIEIRRRRANGETLKAIATDFGVHLSNISIIAKRKGWRHI